MRVRCDVCDKSAEEAAETGGPDAVDDSEPDPAHSALTGAQSLAKSRPRRNRTAAGRRNRRANLAGRGRGGYSGPAPDETDPQLLGSLLPGYVADRGWRRPLAEARVFTDWVQLVGADVAAHCAPVTLRDGELRVSAESTAWATQLRLMSSTLLARLVAEVGGDVIHKIMISGPASPSWKHGAFSVHGARGPRDTYG